MRRSIVCNGVIGLAFFLVVQPVCEVRAEDVPVAEPAEITVRGVVFEDEDGDGLAGEDEQGVAGVLVSSRARIVVTDEQGRFELPVNAADDDVFVIKPVGWRVGGHPLHLLSGHYVHRPAGSPRLFYAGLAATDEVPGELAFGMTRVAEPEDFRVALIADPQPETGMEIDYIRRDALPQLAREGVSAVVSLGDIMFDHLDLFDSYNRAIGALGVLHVGVIGNHDLNFDAETDADAGETFRRIYGPRYRAFFMGRVCFVVLDNIEWLGPGKGTGNYREVMKDEQLAWLGQLLPHVPLDYLVVICAHAPLHSVNRQEPAIANRQALFDLLRDRAQVLAVTGHSHITHHRTFTSEDGWEGAGVFHHHNIATLSGSWWSGPADHRGIPATDQRDGTPNGYVVLDIRGADYTPQFRPASLDPAHQMRIYPPGHHRNGEQPERLLLVNVFDGIDSAEVTVRINGGEPRRMRFAQQEDPLAQAYYSGPARQGKTWVRPSVSHHMWQAMLPEDALPRRQTHRIEVRYRDRFGRDFTEHMIYVP